ncbi:MAG: hypothetical protein ABUK01_13875 [Leptospirales bacterium]
MFKETGKRTISIIAFISFSLLGLSIYGQEEDAGDSKKESTERAVQGSYLKKINSKKAAEKYSIINKKSLYELAVIVGNYGSESEKKTYAELKQNYTEGVKNLYKRKFLEAGAGLEKNYLEIKVLYKTMAERYRDKASNLLSDCAESIVDMELNIAPSADSAPEALARQRKSVYENKHRLSIAYEQFNNGDGFEREENYSLAIVHYRGAITHGVNILIDLAETEEAKNQVREKYQTELYDVENRLSNSN